MKPSLHRASTRPKARLNGRRSWRRWLVGSRSPPRHRHAPAVERGREHLFRLRRRGRRSTNGSRVPVRRRCSLDTDRGNVRTHNRWPMESNATRLEPSTFTLATLDGGTDEVLAPQSGPTTARPAAASKVIRLREERDRLPRLDQPRFWMHRAPVLDEL